MCRSFIKPTIESFTRTQARVKLSIVGLIKLLHIDSQFFQQALRNLAVLTRTLDRLRATIRKQQPTADFKLVSARMSAKIIVTVEDQDSRVFASMLAIEMRILILD